MNKRQKVLLVTMLRSTSLINKTIYSKDKKDKGKMTGRFVGMGILYFMLIFYSFLSCVGYGTFGMISAIPLTMSASIATLSFVFTLLKTNGYLFEFKEYDMLMAMPFETKEIVSCKFLYMYIKNLPWMLGISISMLVGYMIFARPGVLTVLMWIVLSFVLPMIPTVLASAIGALIVAIGTRFKFKKLVQAILMFAFVLFCFSFRFIIEGIFRNNQSEDVAYMAAEAVNKAGKIYPPAKWFENVILNQNILFFALILVVSFAIYELFFVLISRDYSRINSRLASHSAKSNYKMTKQKKRSVENAIAFKEFRRLLGSTNYLVNAAMGQVLTVIMVLVVAIMGVDKLISVITNGAPVSKEMILPGVPYILFFLIGMMATTVCTPSLEGKNYWIVQSLPIEKWTLYKGKMLFNLYMSVPFMVIGILVFDIACKASVVTLIVSLICGLVLCARSTVHGMVCGIKFMKLDWENDIEVVKQGTAVFIYLFPNMIITMLMVVLLIAGSFKINGTILIACITLIEALITAGFYVWARQLAKK